MAAEVQDLFLFATSAGNSGRNADVTGDARYNYATTIAHSFPDLVEVFAGTGVSSQDSTDFVQFQNWIYNETPQAASALENVLIVGSSNLLGDESRFSNRNSHLRAVGERVLSTCAVADPRQLTHPHFCDGQVASYSGTSMAAPTVAGLAAYLWNLDPGLSVSKVRQILLHAFNESESPGLMDAYIAALALDTWPEAGVRRALLDVAGDTPEEGNNGRFDDNDIELFMNQFAVDDGWALDWTRYDLNGDGATGGNSTARFDLTVDWPPAFSADLPTMIENGIVHFDERAVSDCDVLRYYAYTTLYEGDEDRRRELLVPCSGLDLSRYTRLLLTVDIQAVFQEADGTRTEVPFHSIFFWGNGSITGGTLDFAADTTFTNPLTTRDYSGELGGLMATDGARIDSLQASIQNVTYMWGDWTSTENATVVVHNLPISHQGNHIWYQVKGPEACAHIASASAASTWTSGSRTLVDFSCGSESQVWVQLVPPT
jgi:hypothetical protein